MNRLAVIFVIGWCLAGTSKPVMAQFSKKENSDLARKLEEKNDKTAQLRTSTARSNVLEAPIDASAYIIGPGDHLLITIWGQVAESFPTVISPEGFMIIPSVKEIDARNLTLEQLRSRVKEEMARVYTGAEVSVNLTSVRSFRVTMTGLTVLRGSVVVSAVDRVSDAIVQAGGLDSSHANELIFPSRRNIRVIRRTGQVLRADLDKKELTGRTDTDPTLLEGDVIHVSPVKTWIHVYGSLHLPKEYAAYEYVEGERILDAIELAGGLKYGADSSDVEILRFTGDTMTARLNFSLDHIIRTPSDTTQNTRVQPDDRLFVRHRPRFHEKTSIRLEGEVMRPGEYAIKVGKTTLGDVVTLAGGLTAEASLDNIIIYRDPKTQGEDLEFERLRLTPLVDMNDIEKAYFKAKTRQYRPTVQTDFKKLFSDGKIKPAYDVLLKDKDFIEVGRFKKTVTVIGGVVAPGIFDLSAKGDFNYYISKSGGFTDKAKKGDIRIIKPSTQTWLEADTDIPIEDGDIVFVPEKEPVDGWKIFRETIATVGQLATITATIILIFVQVGK